MKILKKLAFLLLMVGLIAVAFALPRLVQRQAPATPTPPEDLAAALAAFELQESDELAAQLTELTESETTEGSETADAGSASEEVEEADVEVGSEETEETVVAEVGSEPSAEPAEATESAAAPPADSTTEVMAFMASLQSGDFGAAKSILGPLKETAEPELVASLQSSLETAQKKQRELEKSRAELAASQQQLKEMQTEGVGQIEAAVTRQLAEFRKESEVQAATAAEETKQLRAEIERLQEVATARPEPAEPAPAGPKPLPADKIPGTVSIDFGFDSSYVDSTSAELISGAAADLAAEDRLVVQLRGFADTTGPSDYNGILARARSEAVKDALIDEGIAGRRVEIISFGETRAAVEAAAGQTSLRRVDIVFREKE
ncbi:MAG: OmpA family protein [Verrucomicrobiota bacterium]